MGAYGVTASAGLDRRVLPTTSEPFLCPFVSATNEHRQDISDEKGHLSVMPFTFTSTCRVFFTRESLS